MSKLISEVVAAATNRRKFLKTLGIATAAVSTMAVSEPSANAQTMTEIDVLNFALNLEYAEAEFYTYGQYGHGIEQMGIGISGIATGSNPSTGGTTIGGKQVAITDNSLYTMQILAEIGSDERAHVSLLRSALGSLAVARPNINLNAFNFGFGNQFEYLTVARLLEDVGVSAYAGAAGLLTTPSIITTAARILAAEAEHVSTVRTQVAKFGISSPQLDAADLLPPPSGPQTTYLSINPSTLR